MPFFDDKLILSDKQAVTSSAASTYELDFGEANANLGAGTPLEVVFIVTTSFADGTSMTLEIQESAAGSSYSTTTSHAAIAEASLVAGATWKLKLGPDHLRYIQAYYTVSGTHGSGNITAYVQPVM